MRYFNCLALLAVVIFAHTSLCARNEYLKSKRGVRGDFSPSRQRALREHARKTKKTAPHKQTTAVQSTQVTGG